ncbi:MAG: hypothetical protein Q8R02_21045, partial [Hyphomonadaceae bacterium]|nr:hypothetical protein [Hyphomonadaceae bacterium]
MRGEIAGRPPKPDKASGKSSASADAPKAALRSPSADPRPLVSVIMFVWNGMPHVERAIRSVLAQDHDHLEYVIQDGGSTDG